MLAVINSGQVQKKKVSSHKRKVSDLKLQRTFGDLNNVLYVHQVASLFIFYFFSDFLGFQKTL